MLVHAPRVGAGSARVGIHSEYREDGRGAGGKRALSPFVEDGRRRREGGGHGIAARGKSAFAISFGMVLAGSSAVGGGGGAAQCQAERNGATPLNRGRWKGWSFGHKGSADSRTSLSPVLRADKQSFLAIGSARPSRPCPALQTAEGRATVAGASRARHGPRRRGGQHQ